MTRDEALVLHAELTALLHAGGGGEWGLLWNRLAQIESTFSQHISAGPLIEKVGDVCEFLQILLRPEGPAPWTYEHAKMNAETALYKMRMAIDWQFPGSRGQ